MIPPPRVLAIAGSDSSGGAGIQADIKTITMLGGYAMTAITAVTAQNSVGVQAIEVMPWNMVRAQIDACFNDIGVDAIKIGMVGSPETALLLADALLVGKAFGIEERAVPVVFDPVMVATSGSTLADQATVLAFDRLMKIATVSTPNVAELAALGGSEGMAERGVTYLAKGGDSDGPEIEDRLVRLGAEDRIWRSPRIETRHTHGTGCTLSSAIATLLGKGLPLEEAIDGARQFVRAALLAAPGFGSGHGPMGHHAVR
jgi:hydroxymethylpyrimidine/phosphomethylpyrimidine kinase